MDFQDDKFVTLEMGDVTEGGTLEQKKGLDLCPNCHQDVKSFVRRMQASREEDQKEEQKKNARRS